MNQADTKKAIINNALILFARQDFHQVSVNRIAAALNTSKAVVYKYFKNKDILLKEVTLFLCARLESCVADMALLNMPVKEFIKSYYISGLLGKNFALDLEIPELENNVNLVYLLFVTLKRFPQARQKLGRVYATIRKGIVSILEWGVKYGEINPNIDPRLIAFEVCAFVEGTMFIGCLDPEPDAEALSLKAFASLWQRIKK